MVHCHNNCISSTFLHSFSAHTHSVCQGKRWGPECANFCPCGVGNRCNPETGDCLCNSCWSGTNCENCESWSMVHPWYIATVTGILFVCLFVCLFICFLFLPSCPNTAIGYQCFLQFLQNPQKVRLRWLVATFLIFSTACTLVHNTLHIASSSLGFIYAHLHMGEPGEELETILDPLGMHIRMYSPQAFATST